MYAEWCLCQDFDPSHDRCDLKQNLLDADCDTTSIVFPDHAENKTLVRHTLLSTAARSPRGMLQHTVCQCNFSNEYCAGAFTLLYRYSMAAWVHFDRPPCLKDLSYLTLIAGPAAEERCRRQ